MQRLLVSCCSDVVCVDTGGREELNNFEKIFQFWEIMKIELVKILRSVRMETSDLESDLRRIYKYFLTQFEQVEAVIGVRSSLLAENQQVDP